MAAAAADQRGSFFVDALAVFGLDQVEFVHEAEDVGRWAEVFQGVDYGVVGVEVAFDFAGFNVEDVD